MEAEPTNGGLYRITMEADLTWLQQEKYVTRIVAQWREGDTHGGLVSVPAEHLDTLRKLLRIREIVPADDGIYADRDGWHAVRHGEVLASGRHGQVPTEVVRSISETTAASTPFAATTSAPPGGATSVLEPDPVCGMKLPPGQEAANVTYEGRTFHFCSNECRVIFMKDPKTYLAGSARREQPIAS